MSQLYWVLRETRKDETGIGYEGLFFSREEAVEVARELSRQGKECRVENALHKRVWESVAEGE